VTELAERLQGLLVAVFGANDALVPIEAGVTVDREAGSGVAYARGLPRCGSSNTGRQSASPRPRLPGNTDRLGIAGVGLSSRTMGLRGRLGRWVFARDRHACPNPPSPAAMREAMPGSTAGVALPGHDAVTERTCSRATVAYGLLMLQKQYSSIPPERSPGGRKCSLSTMWL
jgi:hypothetical protein